LNLDGSGYLLDVQSNLLDGLSTRLVIPILPASQAPKPASRLNPVVSIGDQPHIMVTQFMAAVPEKLLTKHVTSVAPMRDEVTAAIDMLTHGF
jgi:toxin CcdB